MVHKSPLSWKAMREPHSLPNHQTGHQTHLGAREMVSKPAFCTANVQQGGSEQWEIACLSIAGKLFCLLTRRFYHCSNNLCQGKTTALTMPEIIYGIVKQTEKSHNQHTSSSGPRKTRKTWKTRRMRRTHRKNVTCYIFLPKKSAIICR